MDMLGSTHFPVQLDSDFAAPALLAFMNQMLLPSYPGESDTSELYGMTNVRSREGTRAISTWVPRGYNFAYGGDQLEVYAPSLMLFGPDRSPP
jgi:hypothetical protein